MSFTTNIRRMIENPAFSIHQEANRQLYLIKEGDDYLSIIRTDSGEYLYYRCLPEFWEYGETVDAACLEPLEPEKLESGCLPQLFSATEVMNENGFAPVCIYPDPMGEQDAVLVCTLKEPRVFLIMEDSYFAFLNEHSLETLPDDLKKENTLLAPYHIEVQENGTICRI